MNEDTERNRKHQVVVSTSYRRAVCWVPSYLSRLICSSFWLDLPSSPETQSPLSSLHPPQEALQFFTRQTKSFLNAYLRRTVQPSEKVRMYYSL